MIVATTNARSRLRSAAWWGGHRSPPAAWFTAYTDFTQGDSGRQWGLAASLFVMHYRRKHSEGPSFREVFEHLLPETGGAPTFLRAGWTLSERNQVVQRFRFYVLTKWRQAGFVDFDDGVTRSLRTGTQFQAIASHNRHIRTLTKKKPPRSARGSLDAAVSACLTQEGAAARLGITETAVKRHTKAGYLRVIVHDDQTLYPAWQFSPRPGKQVVAGIDVVAPAIPEAWPVAAEHYFMAMPRNELSVDGRPLSPNDWLDLGLNPHLVAGILERYSYDIEP